MRVALVNDVSALGGGATMTIHCAEAVRSAGLEPVVVAPGGWLLEAATERDIETHEMAFQHRRMLVSRGIPEPRGWVQRMREGRQLGRMVERAGIALTVTGAQVPHVASMFMPRRAARVWHLNEVHPRVMFSGPLPARIIGVSKATLVPLQWRATAHDRAVVVSNPVDTHVFRPPTDHERAVARESLGLPPGRRIVVCLARLEPAKGLHDLVAALSTVDHAARPVLAIAGTARADGAHAGYGEGLVAQAERSGVELVLLGEIADPVRVLWAGDVLASASTAEAFGLALAEAGACGLAAVTYAAGGCPEVVLHEKTGLVVPVGDVAQLGSAIRRLLDDHALRHRLGGVAREVAERWRGVEQFRAAFGETISAVGDERRLAHG